MKFKWKVSDAPTGRYRSFEKRCWPSAYYSKVDEICAQIICDDSYEPKKVKSGNHKELKVMVADHSVTPWQWRQLKSRFAKLDDAKAAVVRVLEQNPHFIPKGE